MIKVYNFPLAKESAHANYVDQVIPSRVLICLHVTG